MTTVPLHARCLVGARRTRPTVRPAVRPATAPPSADLLRRSLDAAAATRRHAPPVAVLGLIAALGAAAAVGTAGLAAGLVVGTLALVATRRHDRHRRTAPAPHGPRHARHEQLVATFERLRCAATSWEPAVWEVAAHGVHHPVARRCDGPRHLRATGPVPTFAGAARELAFLPGEIVLRDGRFHTVVGYDTLEAVAAVRERDGGGRLGRLTVRVAGLETVYDLTSVDAACQLAAALRGMRPRQDSDDTGRLCASPTLAL